MTINIADNSPRISYSVASGVTQTSFAVPFEFFDDEDLNVYVDGTLKTLTSDYTVAGGDGSTGTVTISVTGASGGSTVVITRDITLERTTDFPVSGAFNIVALNTELDRLVAVAADLDDRAARALQLTDYDVAVGLTLPEVDDRKGKTLAFNSTTGAVEAGPSTADVQSVSDTAADIALLADIQDGTVATNAITTAANVSSQIATLGAISSDITTVSGISSNVTTVSSNDANVTTVAGISSNVTTVADNIADINTVADDLNEPVSEINTVATDITNVNTVGTNITNVNTTAGSINNVNTVASDITNVNTVSTNISNVNTVAGISANVTTVAGQTTNLQNVTDNLTAIQNAASNATSASNSATAAAASAAAAALSADTFDDTYLGSKASDPSLDNDGDALNAGDLYFNTTSNTLRVYSGSAWQDAAVDSSGFVQTTGDTMTGNLSFGDNDKAIFGAGSDLQIYHDGSNSYIHDAGVGNLHLRGGNQVLLQNATGTLNYVVGNATGEWVKLYHGSLERLETTSTGVHITGNTTFDNGGKAIFGANNDLTIFSDGTHSRIEDSATNSGDLYIRGSNNLRLQTWNGVSAWQDAIIMDDAGAAELYHNGAIKLSTTSTGIDVTGTVTADGLTVQTTNGLNAVLEGTTSYQYLQFKNSGETENYLGFVNDNFTVTAGNTERMRIDSSGNVGIGTSSPSAILHTRSTTPVLTADGSAFSSSSNGTGFGIYRSAAGRTAGYTWKIENAISSGGSTASHYQTDDLLFKARAAITDTTLTEHMRITATGLVDILGGTVELNGNKITGIQVTIADDAFATITPTGRRGGYLSVVAKGDDTFPQHPISAFLYADFGNSPFSSLVNNGANFELNTSGPPTGTTGTDGKVTLFTGGTSGTFYLENRYGSATTFQITLM